MILQEYTGSFIYCIFKFGSIPAYMYFLANQVEIRQ